MRWDRWPGVALCLGACVAGSGAWAQQVYKSVDEQGKVIFSDKPPADAKSVTPVEIKPGPSEADVRAATQRARAMEQAAGEMGRTRKEAGSSSGEGGATDAKGALKEAERRLEEAKEIGPGDRKGTAAGGSRLSEDYRQRVEEAEAAVEAARKRLKE